jgi:bifunctional non-homologous end joining protein LigD
MSLKEYHDKRDFRQTPEPEGTAINTDTDKPRFVIQKHQASHLHYDFRLEMQGVLKSWAIPKGIPWNTGEKRLAIQVEDHPLDYINFEGVIPPGQYGAGSVEIFDKGEYSIKNLGEQQIEFVLKGKRVSGNFVLIHTDGNNWLMIKRNDDIVGQE